MEHIHKDVDCVVCEKIVVNIHGEICLVLNETELQQMSVHVGDSIELAMCKKN